MGWPSKLTDRELKRDSLVPARILFLFNFKFCMISRSPCYAGELCKRGVLNHHKNVVEFCKINCATSRSAHLV